MKVSDTLVGKLMLFGVGAFMVVVIFLIGFPLIRASTAQAQSELPSYTSANMTTWKGLTATITAFPLMAWGILLGAIAFGAFALVLWQKEKGR